MAKFTRFAGLTSLDPGEALSDDGSSFLWRNPQVIDRLLELGAVLHRHDQHPALPGPSADPVVTVAPTGGLIPAGTDIYVCYTLFDAAGGETLANPNPQHVTTAGGTTAPASAPDAEGDYDGGALLAATYFYAITVTDGAGGETSLSDYAAVTIDPGHSSGEVAVSGLATLLSDSGGTEWRLWRSTDGSAWYLLNQGTADTFLDDGSIGGDCTIQPPTVDSTADTATLTVTVPAPSGASSDATQFAIYASPDTDFASPAQLGVYAASAFGSAITFEALTGIAEGAPPHVSLSWPGANKIYADNELIFGLKSPVQTSALLGEGVRGDVRVTVDSKHLWMVFGSSANGPGGWTDLTAAAGGGLEVSGPGAGSAWVGRARDDFATSGALADWTDAGGGAHLGVSGGLLTTTDASQVDRLTSSDVLAGPPSLANGASTPRQVSYVSTTGAVAGFVSPNFGGNHAGDRLTVGGQGGDPLPPPPDALSYYWDGAAWRPEQVYVGPAGGGPNDWDYVFVGRPTPAHPNIYAYKWTGPGQFAEGTKFRVHLRGFGAMQRDRTTGSEYVGIGLSMNMTDEDHGLTYYLGPKAGYSDAGIAAGWTKKPSDLKCFGTHYPPERVSSAGVYSEPGQHPLGGTPYVDLGEGQTVSGLEIADYEALQYSDVIPDWALPEDDIWVEVWREGNTAHAAVYTQDPNHYDPVQTSTFAESLASGPYAAGATGYFGITIPYLNAAAGVVDVEAFTIDNHRKVLLNQDWLDFESSGGVSLDLSTDPFTGAAKLLIGGTSSGGSSGGVGGSSTGGFFGDGSDGAFTADGAATMPGATLASSAYTLTRDVYFSSLTVNSGVSVIASGFRMFVAGTLTNNGTIHSNGTGGSGGGGGAPGGFFGGGGAGGTGGSDGGSTTDSGGGSGGAGGGGGTSPGTATAPGASDGGIPRDVRSMAARLRTYTGGAGGGKGGTQNGGGGGGVVAIFAKTIANAGAIEARGGAGGNGGGGTGGGGGGGGFVFIGYGSLTGAGTTDANAGAGGTGGFPGSAGSAGTVVKVAAV